MSDSIVYRHVPVLLRESVDALITDPNGCYVDVTFGGGGHSKLILQHLGPEGRLFAFDRDKEVIQNIPSDTRFELIISDYRYLKKYLDYYEVKSVHGILADLGLSSYHLDAAERGFSYFANAPLDMRMNRAQRQTASDIVMHYTESALEAVFKKYGELTNARIIAAQLVKDRSKRTFASCVDLARWAEKFTYGKRSKFLAQLFQALRIEVNREMESLNLFLQQASEVLSPGGRLVVISYHSLEDRMVKQMLKGTVENRNIGPGEGHVIKSLYKHALSPDPSEIESNPRSRSAKMRVGVKI